LFVNKEELNLSNVNAIGMEGVVINHKVWVSATQIGDKVLDATVISFTSALAQIATIDGFNLSLFIAIFLNVTRVNHGLYVWKD
jgi:hypothetical protein